MGKGVVALLLLLPVAVLASEGTPEPRLVVALVEGDGPVTEFEDLVHTLLEMPLNHVGVVVERYYLGAGPPPKGTLDRARAVLTYFTADGAAAPDWVWPWLEEEVRPRGLRVIHFGDLAPLERADPERLARWLEGFGLEYDDYYVPGPAGIRVEFADPNACRLEADPRFHASHRGPRSVDPRNRPWVRTRAVVRPDDERTPVVTGPWGGLALAPWTLERGSEFEDRRWHLDPFLFFREALGLERVPVPHPSVLNGRRMWFLHVDGDGFESLSTVKPNHSCAVVMLEEIFRRYELPFTVSIIVRSLTPDYEIDPPTRHMETAREILALPHVEPASHGVLHTLKWQPKPGKDDEPAPRLMWYASLANYQYGPLAEVTESIRFVNQRLLDGDRRCRVMLWTGDAYPSEGAIVASRQAGCWNLNGGVFRWDPWFDSVSFVSPWSRRAGSGVQVYAGAANENDFDGFFTTMPGAFRHIDETIERTGSPRILKPADIYVHFYSCENPARLRVLHDLIRRWAQREPTAPVHASVYARAVHDAVTGARVLRRDNGWALRDFGGCRTARLDGENRPVDFARSRGLLGARRSGESLYLHLAGPDADVVLSDHAPRRPHVEEANCLLSKAVLRERSIAVTATAWNPRLVRFDGFAPRTEVPVRVDGEEWTVLSDERGRVLVEVAGAGTSRIEAGLR